MSRRKELAEAHRTNKPCGKCCFYLLISKTFVEAGRGSSKKKRSSQEKGEFMFANAEEEFFYEVRLSRSTRLGVNKSFLRNSPGFLFSRFMSVLRVQPSAPCPGSWQVLARRLTRPQGRRRKAAGRLAVTGQCLCAMLPGP